ncbi:uncharacterized protein LOC123955389 [Meles meles]|uniref:uncharacterized protein LOC123955389 n=1 Tax=Meles meles TaxID=9662 RepID=UPI001E69D430|nr:uncharacterized protein LOC123955389 [Meles meles]
MSQLISVASFSLGRKWRPFSPLTVVFDPGVFGAHCLGCFSVYTFRAQERSAGSCPPAPLCGPRLPHTLGGPISAPSRALHNGSLATRASSCGPVPPRSTSSPTFPKRWGSAGKQTAGARGRRLRGCGSWVLDTGPSRDRVSPTPRAPFGEWCTRACGALDPALRRLRLGRSARGFHGDGKLASTASATTAKFPAFHPPLGARRDDRGARGGERESGDSDPEPQKIAPKLV